MKLIDSQPVTLRSMDGSRLIFLHASCASQGKALFLIGLETLWTVWASVRPQRGWKLESLICVSCDSNPLVSWFYLSPLSAIHLVKCLPVTKCLPVSLSVCFFACPFPKYSIFPFGAVISCLPHIVTPRVCTATPYPSSLLSFPYRLHPSALAFPLPEPSHKVSLIPIRF